MKHLIAFALFFVFCFNAQAQLDLGSLQKQASGAASTTSYSSLLSSLDKGINTSQLTDTFKAQRGKWQEAAAKATTASEASSLLSQYAGGLKTSAFGKGWNLIKDKWFASSKTVKDNAGLKNQASQLSQNLSTNAFQSAVSKSSFDGLVSQLK
jgi:hypothetical protein